jgi:hypothetical protein
MAIPTRAQQADKLAEWLEAGAEGEEDLHRFALRIVDAFHEMLKSGLKGRSDPLQTGDAFKSPLSSKVYWVAWKGLGQVWITQADSSYGWLVDQKDAFFDCATPSSAKAGKPGSNADWAVDDKVSAFQGSMQYVVLAVHDRGVLLQGGFGGVIQPESNENMTSFYTKEKKK